MKLGKTLSVAAAFAIAAAPIAATAGTRAADSLPAGKVMFENMGARHAVTINGEKKSFGVTPLVIAGVGAAGLAIFFIARKKCRSPGAC